MIVLTFCACPLSAGLACPHLGVMSTEKGVAKWLYSVGVDMNMQVCDVH